MQSLTREGMNNDADKSSRMTQRFNVTGPLLVKLFGTRDRETDEFSFRAVRVRDLGVRSALYGRTFFIALGLVGALGTAAVYWLGGLSVINGTISIGTLVAMAAFVTRIYQPLTQLTNARVDIMTAFVSFDRVFEVLDEPNPITEPEGAVVLDAPAGHLRFDDVSFAYPAGTDSLLASLEHPAPVDQPTDDATADDASDDSLGDATHMSPASVDGAQPRLVLDGVSFEVRPGELVALVGPSGAGKTTLTSLVPRLWDVTSGAVLVDGHDVRDLSLASLRSTIGVVSQDPHLFHERVIDNLRYASPDATDDQIEAACRAAQIHDVLVRLPDGYRTVVGERGYRLSGGEKQRLAIARMLLKDPAVVILDEATSHLDAENEALVQAALTTALAGRTSIVIAHRLSTIVGADRIVVLDDGHVVQQGRHDELLAAGGLYADLYRTLVRSQPVPADHA
jgi:ATP-binding cassette subfamily B protein